MKKVFALLAFLLLFAPALLAQPTSNPTTGVITGTLNRALANTLYLPKTLAYTWTNADVVALGAALTGDKTIVTLPAKTVVKNAYVIETGQAAGGIAAIGTITLTGLPTAAQAVVVGTQTFTWQAAARAAGGAGVGQVQIGADAAAACTHLIAAINLDLATVVASQGAGTTVRVTAAAVGTAGNAITFSENSDNLTMTGSATLGGVGATQIGESLATLTIAVGRTAATYLDYIKVSSIMAAANTVYGAASGDRGTNLMGYDLPNIGATVAVKAHFIATGTNLANVTGSSGTIYIEWETLP